MPKIRIEYEVPEDDCVKCKHCFISIICTLFNDNSLKEGKDHKVTRCQPCIDAEVKEG